jgi:hypothetical protein
MVFDVLLASLDTGLSAQVSAGWNRYARRGLSNIFECWASRRVRLRYGG